MCKVTCPACKKQFRVNASKSDARGATCDCYYCGLLIMIDEDGISRDFHKTMHREWKNWPHDGKGTGYVQMYDGREDESWNSRQ